MDLHDYLQQLNFTMLQQIAKSHRCRIEKEEGDTLPEQVRVHLTSPQGIQECLTHMVAEEKEVLRFLLFFSERPWVTFREILQWSALPGLDIQKGVNLLWLKGVLYVQRRFWGEEVYAMPSDVYHAWIYHLVSRQDPQRSRMPVTAQGLEQEVQAKGAYPPLYQDLLMLLSYFSKHEVTLTQKETIHKRTVKKMQEPLLLPKLFPEYLVWYLYPYQEAYQPGFAFLLDISYRLGLLVSDGLTMQIHQKALTAWLQLSPYEVMEKNFEIFKEVYLVNKSLAYRALMVMESLPRKGDWHTWEEVVFRLEEMRQSPLDDRQLLEAKRILLELFPLTGMIETGQHTDFATWRWTPFSPHQVGEQRPPVEEKFFLQPSFEILVSPFLSLAQQWKIAQMADVKQRDQVMQFFFDEETVNQAFEGGMSLPDILNLLEQGSLSPVPSHITTSLEQWWRQYGRITFTDCVVMTCDDENLAKEIQLNPKLKPFLLGQLDGRHMMVSRENLQKFIQVLNKNGYHPRKKIEVPEEKTKGFLSVSSVDEAEEVQDADTYAYREGLYTLDAGRFGYQLVKALPDPHEWLASHYEMPSTWVKQFRSYHVSTLKEMLQYAAKQDLQLQVDWQGKVFLFSPRQLITKKKDWEVIGWENNRKDKGLKIPLSEVKRVQVII